MPDHGPDQMPLSPAYRAYLEELLAECRRADLPSNSRLVTMIEEVLGGTRAMHTSDGGRSS